jgi:dienelactone hydrolase
MQFVAEQALGDVVERKFVLGEVPGVLWTPTAVSTSAPLILLGHAGGLQTMYPRLLARARRAAVDGFAAGTVELPGRGERPRSAAAEQARADLRRAMTTGERVEEIKLRSGRHLH